jgi:integrase
VRTGKRGWAVATGENDPTGPLYLRWYERSKARQVKADASYEEAELAQLRLERLLKAASQGFVVQEDSVDTNKFHRAQDCLDSYLNHLRATTKRDGRRYNERSIKARRENILQFINLIGKPYVEQYARVDMLRYKQFLYTEEKVVIDTVLNKLMVVTTWLKHNQLVSLTGLLKATDWPIKKKTKPAPFRADEVDKQMKVAGEHKMLCRFARSTGMRKGEIMHAERSDIDPVGKFIHVDDTPKYGYEVKTLASIRDIPIGDDLLLDLLALPDGLLFPNTEGQPDEHIDRRFEEVRKAAGVAPPRAGKKDPCHRWRDTFATDLVRSRKLELWDIARLMGHEDLKTMELYAEHVRMDSEEARQAANVLDSHGDKPGPTIVRKTA